MPETLDRNGDKSHNFLNMLCLRNMNIAVECIIRVEVDFGRETPGDFSKQSLKIYLQAQRVQLGS